ncbi:MAG: YraN family protein [Bacteroidota bacterium]
MAQHNELGKEGEDLAVAFLIKKGYQIIERNWRFKKAEIDIIAQKENTLAMVEVKTRSTNFFGDPQEFIKIKQKKSLISAIDEYVTSRDLDVDVRFDVIGIVKNDSENKIEHLEDAFFHF